MPGKLKVQVIAARDLPVMDRASDLADAFVEVKLGQVSYKTEVCRKSLNPQWQSEWFKFEVDDEELQDEPLQLRIMDYDTYSAHDAIGKVYIDLNPLLWKDGVSEISGWLPIYDTMHGLRGEISVIVKVDLLENVSKFKESSCGVQFFSSSGIPTCYTVSAIHGFVEELVVNDDPEYQWIDMIRTPRASNEARQQLFSKLSGELQRKIGLKVLEREGNAVLGYWQCFDLEGESGIVVRGIGTAAMIQRANPLVSPLSTSPPQDQLIPKEFPLLEDTPDLATHSSPAFNQQMSQPAPRSPSKVAPCRHSSDSDLSTVPLVGSQEKMGSSGSGGGLPQRLSMLPKTALPPITIDILEYPFFTIKKFPPGFLVHLGGVVTARSVKLLDRIHNPDEPETRDAWWTEIRTEIRSHATTMGCHAVIGYKETTSICDEICLLSATGTAAIINLAAFQYPVVPLSSQNILTMSLDRQDFQQNLPQNGQEKSPPITEIIMSDNPTTVTVESSCPTCSICHIPYNEASLPFPVTLSKCSICKRSKVPDVLFTTIEPPYELHVTGRGCCLQASICRSKKKAQGETNAAMISDALPFMEYELHRQLMNKLKVKGMNALFGVHVQIIVGETLLIGVATATASYVTALPPPSLLKITSKSGGGEKQFQSIQKNILDMTARNRDIYDLHLPDSMVETSALDSPQPVITESTEELTEAQFLPSQKDTYVLTVDDVEDKETVWSLFDPELPTGLFSCTTEIAPGNLRPVKHLQMFTMMRTQTLAESSTKHFAPIFDELIQGMCFKLRSMAPCCLCSVCYDINVPDDDVIQLWLTASAVTLGESNVTSPEKAAQSKGVKSTDAEMMFAMEELQATDGASISPTTPVSKDKGTKFPKLEKRILFPEPVMSTWRPNVEITPMSTIPGGIIDRYLGYINLFFVRESMSVRESGGVSGFMYNFTSEVNAIIRSHVASLGGNALVAYNLVDCLVEDRNHQCQCLINVSGDAVHVLYEDPSSTMDSPVSSQLSMSRSQQFCTRRTSSTEVSPRAAESTN
ncbi:C2 domain-containing protein 5-like isoform X1 [Asterias amurensis]|uniref:C2 domain-containing protein 5-like isoform X1 n=1 Tax=Asterias amurensis TaxID=7602 RepID=UPI003AB90CDD